MTDGDENVLDINTFPKLLKATQNSTNFKGYEILFLYGSHLFI